MVWQTTLQLPGFRSRKRALSAGPRLQRPVPVRVCPGDRQREVHLGLASLVGVREVTGSGHDPDRFGVLVEVPCHLLNGGISDASLAAIHHGQNLQRGTVTSGYSLVLVAPPKVSQDAGAGVGRRPYTQATGPAEVPQELLGEQLNRSLVMPAVVAVALVLSACGSDAAATGATSTSTTATLTPTPTPTATVSQYASIITEYEQDWREYEDDIVNCALASIGTKPIDKITRLTCSMTVQTVTITAKTAARNMRTLPKAPAEVSTLVERTLKVLDPLAVSDAVDACGDAESEACDAAITKANGDIRPVTSVLDAWKPYL